MKVALVSIIRNNRKDILPWLAWHAKLGIDSFILFDDQSDDGTELLLKTASHRLDIRLFRIENVVAPFQDRKRIIYLDAISGLKNSFDWVGFLDSNEYLNLYKHDTIHAFLASYEEPINAIAFHRCTYGAGQEILHSDYPDFHAFTRHGGPEHPQNRWVKSFIRPEYFSNMWENDHYFPLSEGRYVTVEKNDIDWEQPGQTRGPAQWETANILYYPGGSLEEIVASALRGHGPLLPLKELFSKELTTFQDSRPQGRTVSLLQAIRPLIIESTILALEKLEALFPPDLQGAPDTAKEQEQKTDFKIARLVPWNKERIEVQSAFAYTRERSQGQSNIFLFFDQNHLPGPAMIFALDLQNKPLDFLIRSDSRLGGFLPYHCLPYSKSGQISLKKQGGLSQSHAFLSAVPREPLIADRLIADEWEIFETELYQKAPNGQKWLDLAFFRLVMTFLTGPRTINAILALKRQDHSLTARLLPFLMEYLSPEEKRIMQAQLCSVQPYLF